MTLDELGPRICIMGPSNSGKSTMAEAISRARGLVPIHLDQLHHLPNTDWIPRPADQFEAHHDAAIMGSRWVMDGNYSRLLPRRLQRATGFVLLDVPTLVNLYRYIRRCWFERDRPGALEGGLDSVKWDVIHHIAVATRANRVSRGPFAEGAARLPTSACRVLWRERPEPLSREVPRSRECGSPDHHQPVMVVDPGAGQIEANMIKRYKIFADYHQFYLWDHGASPDAPTQYTEEDTVRRIKTGPFLVVVQPERDMDVPVEVEVADKPPNLDLDAWDHVTEASLDVPSGRLEIHECTGGSIDILAVLAGTYRVRAHHAGRGTLSEDRLDGDDHYRIVLWPAPFASLAVLKQYVDPNAAS